MSHPFGIYDLYFLLPWMEERTLWAQEKNASMNCLIRDADGLSWCAMQIAG